MAKTVDEIQINVGVNGTASLNNLDTSLKNIEASSASTARTLNAFNVRNVAYQIQDIAVQAEMGTSAFRIFTQQAPQLLSAFGTVGAVLGAVAAVTLPLLQYGLKLAGYDSRSLTERITDLTKATNEYQAAQKANLPSLAALSYSYGSLSDEAKKFFEIQQQLQGAASLDKLKSAIKEQKEIFYRFSDDAKKKMDEMGPGPAGFGVVDPKTGKAVVDWWKRLSLGLSEEQAKAVGNMFQKIDENRPTEAVGTINDILTYLKETIPEGNKFRRTFEETVKPMLEIQANILKIKENIKAAGEEASAFNASMLNLQTGYIPDIGAAKRSFDQVKAIRLEGLQKIAEYELQANEKTKNDAVDRSKEIAAFRLKTETEVSDKIKDVANAQKEAAYAVQQQNETRDRALRMENQIIGLKAQQIDSIDYAKVLEEEVLKNINDQISANMAVEEQYRKGLITRARANDLEQEIAANRKQADANAQKQIELQQAQAERGLRIQFENIARANSEKLKGVELEGKIYALSANRQTLERGLLELQNQRQRQIAEINNNDKLTSDQKLESLIKITEEYGNGKKALEEQFKLNESLTKDFSKGWEVAYSKYVEDAQSAGEQAKSIFGTVTRGIEDLIVNFVQTGKMNFKDLANSIIAEFVRIQAKKLVAGLFGGGSGSMGDFFAAITGKATGGPVSANTPYLIGEKGPELFVPNTTGTIVPNHALGGSGTSVTYNINAVDAASFRQMLAREPEFLYAVTERGRNNLPVGSRR